MDETRLDNLRIALENIGQVLVRMENDFSASFGPNGAISKQLNDITKALLTIAARKWG